MSAAPEATDRAGAGAGSSESSVCDGAGWQPMPFTGGIAGLEPSAFAAFMAFHAVFNTFSRMRLRDLTEDGTQPSHVECLRVLALQDGMCQRDIAAALRVSRARVTGIVQALEQAGYVTRARDRGDKRFARVHLTELGHAADEKKGELRDRHIVEVFGSLPEHDRRELTRLLGELDRRFQRRLERDAASG